MATVAAYAPAKNVTDWGGMMETEAYLETDNGHMAAWTHIWSENWVLGFHGSVGLVFLGAENKPLGVASDVHTFWVDAKSVFWSRSSATEPWEYDIDAGVAGQCKSMLILQSHTPRANLKGILDQIAGYAKDVQNFCTENPQVCAAIGGLA